MLTVSVCIAVSCHDLMTSEVRLMRYLGAIITLSCAWMFSAHAFSSQQFGLEQRLQHKLDAVESTIALTGHNAIFQCSEHYMSDVTVQWLKDNVLIGTSIDTTSNYNERRKTRRKKHTIGMQNLRQRRRRTRSADSNLPTRKPRNHTSSNSLTLPQDDNIRYNNGEKMLQNSKRDSYYTVLSNASLLIRNINDAHAGEYICILQDKCGKILRRKFQLTIANLPQCTIKPMLQLIKIGGAAHIKCSTDSVLNVTYTWTKDGKPLPHNDRRYEYLPTGVLQIFNVKPYDAGTYICHIESLLGSTSSDSAIIKITSAAESNENDAALTFNQRPQNLTIVLPYKSAIFECLVKEPGNITYGWVKDDGISKICPEPDSNCLIKELNNNLWLGNLAPNSRGKYTCIVRRKGKKQRIESSAYLEVLEKPVFSITPSLKEIPKLSQTISFACRVEGNPRPRAYWMKDGVVLKESKDPVNRKLIQHIGGTSYLQIITIRQEDTGYYQCIGENGVGGVAAGVKLSILTRESIPPPLNVTATAISDKEILVHWSRPDTLKNITAFTVEFKNDAANSALIRGTHAAHFNKIVIGLQPFTTYAVRVVAYTKLDTSESSQYVKVRTKESEPSGKVNHDDIRPIAVNSTAILLLWTSLPRHLQSGIVTKYKIIFTSELMTQDKINYGENFIETPTRQMSEDPTGVTEYALITNLLPGQNYGMTIRAATNVGYGPESDFVDITLPNARVSNCDHESGSAILTSSHGKFVPNENGLQIYWNLKNTTDVSSITITLSSIDDIIASQALEPSTSVAIFHSIDMGKAYIIAIKLINHDNETCETRTFAVLPGEEKKNATIVGMPKNLNAVASALRCINITWSYEKMKDETFFSIRYKLYDHTPHKKIFKYTNSTETQFELCGLKPWSGYEFAVAAVTDPDTWMTSDDKFYTKLGKTIWTAEEKPGPPSNLFCENLSHGKVECSWDSPKKPNGVVKGYTLLYNDADNIHSSRNKTKRTVVVLDCMRPTTYVFQVLATNNAGDGVLSISMILHISDYNDDSMTNCTFELPVDDTNEGSSSLKTVAISVGIAIFSIIVCLLLIRFCCPWKCRICEKTGCKKTVKHLGQNGSSKSEGSVTKQNGHIVKKNGFHRENDILAEQEITLLSNGNGNGSVSHCNGNGYKHLAKKNGLNGFHKNSFPNGDSTSVEYETSSMNPRGGSGRNGFKKTKLDKKNGMMAVPHEIDVTQGRSCNQRLVLSVPIPKHASKTTKTDRDTANHDNNIHHSQRSLSGTN